MKDRLAGTAWSEAGTVAGFAQALPNPTLMRVAAQQIAGRRAHLLDIGCGAGRNAIPLANQGWSVTGVDLSLPMLEAAAKRARVESTGGELQFALAPMERLPLRSNSVEFIVAHGIWNLATSSAQFRQAVREAARVAKPGSLLFIFTFSRNTLGEDATPVEGEQFVFTQFSGTPQCFLTARELVDELGTERFVQHPAVPLTEHNRPASGARRVSGPPVIWEGTFRYEG